ncbi:hypothetical protein [Gottfriedia acidiceleris]|uniref:Cell division protein FtsL n=1 Tax=Gottfriedia acidiceleris TaxID=371036 RepID=A0ABY4JGA5_9BACI|nr:hypothetical protein [Gottfriedia acidiceleris]UPM52864.1 hypothetical protein MY490_13600 [Gottfriedia acidiceleris]
MKKFIFFVYTIVICLGVNLMAFYQISIKKTNSTLKEHVQIEAQNKVIADKNINILNLPLPHTDQRKYSVKKLPINGSQKEIKKLNNIF